MSELCVIEQKEKRKRWYAGQDFDRKIQKLDCSDSLLEQHQMLLYVSGNLVRIKAEALKILIMGLGCKGKEIFDEENFVVERNELNY